MNRKNCLRFLKRLKTDNKRRREIDCTVYSVNSLIYDLTITKDVPDLMARLKRYYARFKKMSIFYEIKLLVKIKQLMI